MCTPTEELFMDTACVFYRGSDDGGKILGKDWTVILDEIFYPGSAQVNLG